MKEFTSVLLGDMETTVFLAYLFIALLAALLMMGIRGNRKKESSIGSPEKFSILFLLQDNIQKLAITVLTIAFTIRFSVNLIGQDATGWAAFLIGIGSDRLTALFQKLELKARK
jgi:hypothetical protein